MSLSGRKRTTSAFLSTTLGTLHSVDGHISETWIEANTFDQITYFQVTTNIFAGCPAARLEDIAYRTEDTRRFHFSIRIYRRLAACGPALAALERL